MYRYKLDSNGIVLEISHLAYEPSEEEIESADAGQYVYVSKETYLSEKEQQFAGDFPDCWEYVGGHLAINLTKAKAHKQKLISDKADALLAVIDAKTPRALREREVTGDPDYVIALEDRSMLLRAIKNDPDLAAIDNLEDLAAYDSSVVTDPLPTPGE